MKSELQWPGQKRKASGLVISKRVVVYKRKRMADIASIEAHDELEQSGEGNRQRHHIWSFLLAHGPMTSAEYYEMTGMNTGKKAITQSRARFTELYYEGRLERLPRRECRVTGMKVNVWRALPGPTFIKRDKPISRALAIKRMNMAIQEQSREHALREEAEREVARLRAQIAELKAEVSSLTGIRR